jgi:hypothetical protein
MRTRIQFMLIVLFVAGLLALWPAGSVATAQPEVSPGVQPAYQTHSVFVVVIDGIRDSEAFDDPIHEHIPRIWNELRPQGTLLWNFYNRAETYTTPGNNTIANGVWAFAPNIGHNLDLRPQMPTIFEYYRCANPDVPKEKVWAIVGKGNVRHVNYSLHPLYGEDCGATLILPAENKDKVNWEALQGVMDRFHPDLVFFHLGEVDHAGHTGDWDQYTDAIEQADGIVGDLWEKIQSDPYYRDRTTMIVTTDHGRHDDDHGGFQNHGGICEGDKRLIFLALGPDIRPGVEIETVHEQVDIAPTVGELMGFETPLAEGHVLREMLIRSAATAQQESAPASPPDGARRLTFDPARSEHPDIAANDEGLHVVWTDDRSGVREIYYIRRPAGGAAWTPPEMLSESGVEARAPAIAAADSTVHVAWLDYRDGNWSIYYRRREAGGTWTEAERLGTSHVEVPPNTPPAMLWEPDLAVSDSRVVGVAPVYPIWVRSKSFGPDDPTWVKSTITNRANNGHGVSIAARGDDVYVTWTQIADQNWEVFFAHSADGGRTWSEPRQLVHAASNSYDPAVAVTENAVHVVWADDYAGGFQVVYKRSYDQGETWSPPMLLTRQPGWFPALTATDGRLVLAWESYRTGNGEIVTRTSLDEGLTWSGAEALTDYPAFSVYPALAGYGRRAYAVWQDNRAGNFEIYFKPVPAPGANAGFTSPPVIPEL